MNLVHFLVAGVRGAELGTATFLLRGTSTPATIYSDFEGTTALGSHIVSLNSHGSAEVYTSSYNDVQLHDSGGSLIRTVTVGNSSNVSEYIGDSFTGVDYIDASTGINKPVTVKAVLDRWNDSAGATNFQVDVDGVATDIDAALAASAGLFINVKSSTYGAVGDGVTDDTVAINLAIADAEGKILFFPEGIYRVTSEIDFNLESIHLMGTSPQGSQIKMDSATGGNFLDFSPDSTADCWILISNLSLNFAQSCAKTVINIASAKRISIENCEIGDSFGTGPLLSAGASVDDVIVYIDASIFRVDASSSVGFQNLADDGECQWFITKSFVLIESGFDNSVFVGPDFNINLCKLFTSSASAHYIFDCESNETAGAYIGNITSCNFQKSAGDGVAFKLDSIAASGNFVEMGNSFNSAFLPDTVDVTGTIYDIAFDVDFPTNIRVSLGSRFNRSLVFTGTFTGTVTCDAHVCAENVILNENASGTAVTLVPFGLTSLLPPGNSATYALNNASGSTKDVVFSGAGSGDSVTFTALADSGSAVATYKLITHPDNANPVIVGSGKND